MPHRSFLAVPVKTPIGQDELQLRHLKLQPRQRTMLQLVDGQRDLDEVLYLAHRAGAPARHFDELMALGLVSLPLQAAREPEFAPTSPMAPLSSPGVLPPPRLDADSPAGAVAAMLERMRLPTLSDAVEPAEPEAPFDALTIRSVLSPIGEGSTPPPADRIPTLHHKIPETGAMPLDLLPMSALDDPDGLLQRVRDLLYQSLASAPLFSARTLLQLRQAQTRREFAELTAEIARHLSASRRLRTGSPESQALQSARELLGIDVDRFPGDATPGDLSPYDAHPPR